MTELASYPRPPDDTGIGFHYYTDALHYDREAIRFWRPELQAMGVKWLVLRGEPTVPIPEDFLRALVAQGIEPVVRIAPQPIRPLDDLALASLARVYAGCGVHYVYLYGEPNVAAHWPAADWARPDLVDRFANYLLPGLVVLLEAGLWPLLSPLRAGGDYWDTTFLGSLLDIMKARTGAALFERLGLCIHNYAGNRPLSWGQGGSARWPQARPYRRPSGIQDHRGFRLFEWYDEIVRAKLGLSLPQIAGESGLTIGTQDDREFPPIDELTHSMRIVELARLLMDDEVPPYLFNHAFFALGQSPTDHSDAHAFYRADGRRLAAVGGLKLLKKRRRAMPEGDHSPSVPPGPPQPAEPSSHYLLILVPVADADLRVRWPSAVLQAAAEYVARFRPTVGFDPQAAARASHITIVAPPGGDGAEVERRLAKSGRVVERLEAATPDDARRALDELARRGQRFFYEVRR
ncbi:MAG: hypothetical protein HYY04_05480 [Chloroflexi bacterium]|nr:hypothetical protein [Chloroflexota bacterium]